MRKIKHNEFHYRMIAYNKPIASNKTFVQVCGIKIKDSIEKRCLAWQVLEGEREMKE